ncbi:deoxyribose-phosphate aldolase [Prochlorococcus sp. MIT 1307]|uniref:deoxyribose-phosphate aldolase n=1 Tax=Prochlorococcus sp. MIT 1307 TaxID=3096219 RepID=UPI002A762D5A|nr:deoxyribose-phosphate aldolase [Prochlorococcus sp. MIT 1307]
MEAKNDLPDLSPLIHQAALNPHLSIDDLNKLCDASRYYSFSGFCTNLSRLTAAREKLGPPSQTKLIAVIAFPFGFITSKQKQAEAEWAVERGAEELEVVPNFLALTEEKTEAFAEELAGICETGIPVRVILDTVNLHPEKLSLAVEAAIDAGVFSLQNGNGFGRNVLSSDIHQLSKLTRGRCEVKAVGGVKTVNQVVELIEAGATKIGTTVGPQLIQSLLKSTK